MFVRRGIAVLGTALATLAFIASPAYAADEIDHEFAPGITLNIGNATDSTYYSRTRVREMAAQLDADGSMDFWKLGLTGGLSCAAATRNNPYAVVVCAALLSFERSDLESTFKNAALDGQCVKIRTVAESIEDGIIWWPSLSNASVYSGGFCQN